MVQRRQDSLCLFLHFLVNLTKNPEILQKSNVNQGYAATIAHPASASGPCCCPCVQLKFLSARPLSHHLATSPNGVAHERKSHFPVVLNTKKRFFSSCISSSLLGPSRERARREHDCSMEQEFGAWRRVLSSFVLSPLIQDTCQAVNTDPPGLWRGWGCTCPLVGGTAVDGLRLQFNSIQAPDAHAARQRSR